MRAQHGRAIAARRPHDVVEGEHAARVGDASAQERLDFRVVARFDGVLGGKVHGRGRGRAGRRRQGFEGVDVDGEGGFAAADVVDRDGDVGVAKVALRQAGGRVVGVVPRLRAVRGRGVEFYLGADGAAGDVGGIVGGGVVGRFDVGWCGGSFRVCGNPALKL